MRKYTWLERLIAVCCTLAILLSTPLAPLSASAESGVSVTASTNASVKQGNSAYCYVSIDSMERLSTLELTVHFDPTVVSVTGSYNQVEAVLYDSSSTESTLQYTYIFDGNGAAAQTQLFYFQYTVLSDAPVGESYFDIVVGDAYDANLQVLPVSGSRCSFGVTQAVTDLTCSIRGTSSVSTSVNQEFTLSYRFSTTAIASGTAVIRYDPELFAVADVVQGAFLADKMTDINTSLSGAVYLSFLGTAYADTNDFLAVRFKTLQNVATTDSITMSVTDLYDLQLNPISCSDYSTAVTVTYDATYDETAPYVYLEQVYDAQAQKLTVLVQLEANSHLGAGDFVLQFDTGRLAYGSAVKGYSPTFFSINDKNAQEGLLKFSVISLQDMTDAVTMLTATFDVLTPCENTPSDLAISGSGLANHLTEPIVLNFTGCTVETAGHTVAIDPYQAPTCLETGLTEGSHCSICKTVLVAQETIPALGHDEIPHEALAPTCTEIGWEAYVTCSRCDYTTYAELPANGHSFYQSVCTVCGADQEAAKTWDISAAGDGSLTARLFANHDGTYDLQITGSSAMTDWSSVGTVPWYDYRSRITGVRLPEGLTTIGNYAFRNFEKLTEVTLPESLQMIGKYAFRDCTGLTQINFNAIQLADLSQNNHVFSSCGTAAEGITVSVGSKVTKLPAYLFYPYSNNSNYTPNITAVEFEDNSSCTQIGRSAFYGCTGLTELKLPEGLQTIGSYAFSRCIGLTELQMPESLQTIGSGAFYGCKGLTAITIVENLQTLGEKAFANCTGLTEIRFDATAMADLDYDSYVFNACGADADGITVTFGSQVARVPAYLFYADSVPNVAEVTFEAGSLCREIGGYAFCNCAGLTRLTLPEGLQSIGEYAFQGCAGLTALPLPESLETIGSYAFYGCKGLTAITIVENLQSLGNYAFCDCTGLTEIRFHVAAMADMNYNTQVFAACGTDTDGITVTFGSQVTKVPAYLFCADYVPNVAEVTFEAGSLCREIGSYAFYNCAGLRELTLPEGLQSIGEYAFYYCAGLTRLTLPESLQSLGNYAFYGCTGLTTLQFNAVQMSNLSDYNYVFSFCGQDGEGITVTVGSAVTRIPARLLCPYPYANDYAPKVTSVVFEAGSVCESIGAYAFYRCSAMTELVLPAGLQTIESYAFGSCTGLTALTLPAGLKTLGNQAFSNCTAVTALQFNATAMESAGSNAFYQCGTAGEGVTVTIGNQVTCIPDYLFYCSNMPITGVIFQQESVCQRIGDSAFEGSSQLKWIEIPASVTAIGQQAFYNCHKLTIGFATDVLPAELGSNWNGSNPYILSAPRFVMLEEAGYVILGEKAVLTRYYGTGTEYRVESAVEGIPVLEIYTYAFRNQTQLTEVILPEGLQTIGNRAFEDANNLRKLLIPATVTQIGEYAFYNCSKLNVGFQAAALPENVGKSWLTTSRYYLDVQEMQLQEDACYAILNSGTAVLAGYYGQEAAYTVQAAVGTVPVTAVGNYAFRGNTTLTEVRLPEGITSVGGYAFCNCSKLEVLTLPEGLESIGSYAFSECSALQTLVLPESLRSIENSGFMSCSALVEVTLPENLQTLGGYAFAYCSALQKVNLPAGLTTLGEYAFYYCKKLESVRIDAVALNDLPSANCAFVYCGRSSEGIAVTVGSSVTRLPAYLFYTQYSSNLPKLTTVVFEPGSACESIGSYAFAYAGLTELTLPDGLQHIENQPFYNCTALKEITLPESLETIGSYTFYGCTGLTQINFNAIQLADLSQNNGVFASCGTAAAGITVSVGSKVTKLPAYLFYPESNSNYVPKIAAVEFAEDSVCQSIGNSAFYNCTGLTEITLPESLQTIGNYAFYDCTGLTEITLPEGLQTIGSYAFYGCTGLTELALPDGLETIGSSAFRRCTGLTALTLPERLTTLGNYAFSDCTGLTKLQLNAIKLQDLRNMNYVFYNCGTAGEGITVTVGSQVTQIPAYLFYPYSSSTGVPKITAVRFAQDSVCQRIGSGAFVWNIYLRELTLPESLQTIEDSAFGYCSALTRLTIPEQVTAVNYHAFIGCTALGTVFIPSEAAARCTTNAGLTENAQILVLPATVAFSNSRFTVVEEIVLDGVAYKVYSTAAHQWEAYETLVPMLPCERDGLVRYHCAHCDFYQDVTVPKHILTQYEAKEPDCVNIGWYAYEACGDCDYTTYEEIPALGHIVLVPDTSGTVLHTVQNNSAWPFDFDGTTYSSTNKTDSTTASVTVTALYDCTLDIIYKVSSEANYDILYVYHNGVTLVNASGEVAWQTQTIELAAGDTVMLTYSKDGSAMRGEDTAWFRLQSSRLAEIPAEQVEPDCLNPVVCHRCKEERKAALGHDLVAHEARAVSCLEIGWDAYDTCSRCDYSTYVEIPALGHDPILHEAQAPTCLNIGWEAYDTCSRCDYSTYVEIPALGHDLIAHEAQVENCTEIGWEAYDTCSRCDYSTYVEIPALGHDRIAHEAQAVTCLEIGWDAYDTCSRCDYTTYAEIPALGHDLIHHEAQAVTCLEIGWDAYDTCSRCDYTTYTEIPPTGHWIEDIQKQNDPLYPFEFDGEIYASTNKLDNTTSTFTITATEACTLVLFGKVSSEGNYDKLLISHNGMQLLELSGEQAWQKCELSLQPGDRVTVSYRKDGSVAAGQDTAWFRYQLTEGGRIPGEQGEPTCTEPVVCTLCGEKLKEALGHDAISHEAKTPTCTEIGWKSYETCNRCDYTTYEAIPATGHSFVQTFCTACGEKQPPLYTWDVSAAGDSSLTAQLYRNYAEGGYELEFTGSGAMRDYTSYGTDAAPWSNYRESINRVSLPEGLTSIGNYAFNYCTELRQIWVPDSVERIGQSAFRYADNLVIILEGDTLPENLGFNWSTGCGYYLNPQKLLLEQDVTYVIDQDGNAVLAKYLGSSKEFVARETVEGIPVTRIGEYAFYQRSNLSTYWIPNGIQTIGANAFNGCDGLVLLLGRDTLPASLGSSWNGSSPYYLGAQLWTENDILFVKDQSDRVDIVQYQGDGEEVLVPAQPGGYSLTRIRAYAFYGSNVKRVILPEGITSIENNAFDQCTQLQQIQLPQSLVEIKTKAFDSCRALRGICLPENLKSLGSQVFWDCSSLQEIVLPEGLTKLESSVFCGCSALKKVVLPDSITTMSHMVFYQCTSLEEINLPQSLTYMSSNVFYQCTSLKSIELPKQLHSLTASTIFDGCSGLKVVYVRSSELAATLAGAEAASYAIKNAVTVVVPAGTGTDYLKSTYPYCETRERNGMTVDVYSQCAHEWTTEMVTEYVHCEQDGYGVHACSLCGVQTDTRTPKHTLQESIVEPTCTALGYTLYSCPDCGESYKTAPVEKLGHDADPDTFLCNRCGEEAYLLWVNTGADILGYSTWEQAMLEAPFGSSIQLRQDITGDVVLSKTIYLDLNGYSIDGTVTINSGCTLYGMDSGNDDLSGFGTIGGIAGDGQLAKEVTLSDGRRYAALTDETGISFHRWELQLHTVTLRTAKAGIYYKASLQCDETMRAQMDRYGVALSLADMPGTDFQQADHYTWRNGATTGEFTSGSVFNILRSDLTPEENAARAEMKIYANAYLQLADGTILMSDITTGDKTTSADFDGIAYSLFDVMQLLDEQYAQLAPEAQQSVAAFYAAWKEKGMQDLQLKNISTEA